MFVAPRLPARWPVLILAVSTLLAGCPGSLEDPELFLGDAGCPDIPSTLLVPTCGITGCHGAKSPQAGLDLASPGVEDRLVDRTASTGCADGIYVPKVNPTSGVFYQKLTDSPPCGSRMPFTGNALTDAQLACVANWVNAIASPDAGTPPLADSGVSVDSGVSMGDGGGGV
jgi:hypothetical protein